MNHARTGAAARFRQAGTQRTDVVEVAQEGTDDLDGVLVGHVEALGLDGPSTTARVSSSATTTSARCR